MSWRSTGPEQLKALGHPLRLKVLQVLGESDEPAHEPRARRRASSVDPGHLHFHVRMLHRAGLIELAETGGTREAVPPGREAPEGRPRDPRRRASRASCRPRSCASCSAASSCTRRTASSAARRCTRSSTSRRCATLLNELLDEPDRARGRDEAAADDHGRVPPCDRAGRDGLGQERRRRQHRTRSRVAARARCSTSAVSATGDVLEVLRRASRTTRRPTRPPRRSRRRRRAAMHASASATSCGKSSRSRSDLRHVARLGPAAEREQRERRRVPADRRLGGRRAELERPARELVDRRVVAREQRRLQRADRAAPRHRDPRRRPSSRASARPPAAAIRPTRSSPAIR